MNGFTSDECLHDTFAHLNDVTICGKDQTQHDENLARFLDAAKRKNFVYNEQKYVFSTRTLNILGSVVCNGEIKPDLERLKPLREFLPPKDSKVQKRVLGVFSYYSMWIKLFFPKDQTFSSKQNVSRCWSGLRCF